jgi:2-polyprenyl-3-methyl-5-hydroxy-6-metoxy-1,4-benzoquinol methylase
VLEHIPKQLDALSNLRSALRPGGIAFFHIPTVRERPVPFSRWLTGFHAWAEKEHAAEERSAEEFIEIVRSSGLEVVKSCRTFGYFTGELATRAFP